MKILITSDWYKPVINGVVTSVENLKKGLNMAGHDVRILTLSGNTHSRIEDEVYYVGSIDAGIVYPNARLARLKLAVSPKIIRNIMEWKPDIIHSQCEFSTFFIARHIAYDCKIPLVHTYHTVYEDFTHYFCPNQAMGKRVAKVLSKQILTDTHTVIVPSEKIKTMLTRYGVEKPIHVIPSGIDVDRYLASKSDGRIGLRESLGISPAECVLLFVGRLAKEKNIEELFAFLKNTDPTQRMLIVGDGPYRNDLENIARQMGVWERLIFTGMVLPSQIPDYYAAGDIFVSASSSETQGLTYIEAMASGLPLLCRADDCLNGVISNGVNGLLYHTESEFLQHLHTLKNDFAFRNQIGIMARQSVQKRYSVQAFAASCVNVYESSIQSFQ